MLTRDHTVASEQVRLGILSAGEAAGGVHQPRAEPLAGKRSVRQRRYRRACQVLPGDVLALCSDGLHGSVEPGDIAAVAAMPRTSTAAARRLVALANERDGSDNISVQLIRIRSVERVGMYRGRPYKLR